MKHKIISLCLLVSTLSFSQGSVDGFFKQKGDLDLAFSGTYSGSTIYLTPDGDKEIGRTQAIIGVYGTYGLTDNWDVILSLPLINFVPQDAAIFTKYKLVGVRGKKSEFTLAPAVGVTFPMKNYATQTAQAIGQKATIIQPKLIMQIKHDKNWFVQAQGGYNYALSPVPSAVAASIKAGYIYKKWYFDAWFDYQFAIGGENYGFIKPDFRELGVSYNRVGGVIYKGIGKWSGVFVNGSYVLSGRNIGQAFSVGAGYVLKLNTKKKSKA